MSAEIEAEFEKSEHDRNMLARVRPSGWAVEIADDYDFVAVGGGTAGLVGSAGAAHLGARTLLIERALLGGDCLVTGCVPSKALLHAARRVHDLRQIAELGIEVGPVRVDFRAVLESIRAKRAEISETDGASVWAARGVDISFGEARFTSPGTLEIDGRPVRFKRALIATGGRPRVPDIPGLAELDPLTSDTLFHLRTLPDRLLILGGGPIAVEIGQAMARLGSAVTIIERGDRLLPDHDPDASAILHAVLEGEGVQLYCGTELLEARREAAGLRLRISSGDGESRELVGDRLLVATGRTANVEGLGLEHAEVESDAGGIRVDRWQRTRNRRIYAAGDVCSPIKLTHAAWAQAEYAVINALSPLRMSMARRVLPAVVYTDPELAQVGLTGPELAARGVRHRSFTVGLEHCDRARIEGETRGFARVHLAGRGDRILGATVVCRQAGEVIAQLGLAMQMGLGLSAAATTVYAYPTRNELVSRLADAYNFARVTPGVRRFAKLWFRWGLW